MIFQKLRIIAGRLEIRAVAFIRYFIWCKENLTLNIPIMEESGEEMKVLQTKQC